MVVEGDVRSAQKEYDLAIKDYDRALMLEPGYVLALMGRAWCYSAKNQLDQAFQDFDTAINRAKMPDLYFGRGSIYARQGKAERAIADFTEAIRLDPKWASPYVSRGEMLRIDGEFDRAMTDYDRAIQLNPKAAMAYGGRGIIFLSVRKDVEAALKISMPQSVSINNIR